jgi:hypothetical protein
MKKNTVSVLMLALGFQLGGCFACDPPDGYECTQNSDCAGGDVCIEAECYKMCSLQVECGQGMYCSQDGLCEVEEASDDGPVIASVSGNDPSDATRVADGVVVTGERLANAALEVRGEKGSFGLSIRSASDQRVEAAFPPNILDGRYTLVAVNGAGEDQTYVELTLPWLTSEELITRINASESDTKLAVSVLPVGTSSSEVAAGDHEHAGVYAPVSHEHNGVYAPVSHEHAGVYAPVSHDHNGVYAPETHAHTGADLDPGSVGLDRLSLTPHTGEDVYDQDGNVVDDSDYFARTSSMTPACETVQHELCILSVVGLTGNSSGSGTHRYCSLLQVDSNPPTWSLCARGDTVTAVTCQMTCF